MKNVEVKRLLTSILFVLFTLPKELENDESCVKRKVENGLIKFLELVMIDPLSVEIFIMREETVGALKVLPYATEVEKEENA